MADTLGLSGHAIALIGRDGRVVHMNTRFKRLIGEGVHLKGERLASWQVEAHRALSAAIDHALRPYVTSRDAVAAVVLPRRQRFRPPVREVSRGPRHARSVPH